MSNNSPLARASNLSVRGVDRATAASRNRRRVVASSIGSQCTRRSSPTEASVRWDLLEQQAVRQALAPRLGEAQIGLMLEISLVHPHTIVSMLINDLADIDNEVFLFLDDYHLVTDPAIRRVVSFLLRHVPSHLHLVLTTRLEPPLSLGGLLAKNRLLEVDASVLRFDYSFARPISSRGACLHPPRADGTVGDV
jgi:hypothetical protein